MLLLLKLPFQETLAFMGNFSWRLQWPWLHLHGYPHAHAQPWPVQGQHGSGTGRGWWQAFSWAARGAGSGALRLWDECWAGRPLKHLASLCNAFPKEVSGGVTAWTGQKCTLIKAAGGAPLLPCELAGHCLAFFPGVIPTTQVQRGYLPPNQEPWGRGKGRKRGGHVRECSVVFFCGIVKRQEACSVFTFEMFSFYCFVYVRKGAGRNSEPTSTPREGPITQEYTAITINYICVCFI